MQPLLVVVQVQLELALLIKERLLRTIAPVLATVAVATSSFAFVVSRPD